MHSTQQHAELLAALLPTGPLWESLRQSDTVAAQLTLALAGELARTEARVEQLIAEADPREASELLTEWEAWAGLPEPCSGPAETIEQRRDALVAKLTAIGGQSRAYFIALAERLGLPGATITEYDPFTVGSSVAAPIYGPAWQFAWKLTAPAPAMSLFSVASSVAESLGETPPTTRLECAINRRKPAHTKALFEYV